MLNVRCRIKAPLISRELVRNTGLPPRYQQAALLPGKKMLLVDEEQPVANTSNVLLPGWLVPAAGEVEPVVPEQMEKVMVKLSGGPLFDEILSRETGFLRSLAGTPGVPELVGEGALPVKQQDHRSRWLERDCPYAVLPFFEGNDLQDLMVTDWGKGGPSWRQLSRLLTEVLPSLAERLASLHQRNIVHRDVKPNNARFDLLTREVTLLDLGRANRLDVEPRADQGTFGFYPPENELSFQLEREDIRQDTFGLGVTSHVLLSGADGLLLDQMTNVFRFSGIEFMFMGRDRVYEAYYRGLMEFAGLSPAELAVRSNLPAELKETPIAPFLASLFHPDREQRPADLMFIAQEFRRLGGALLEHQANGPSA